MLKKEISVLPMLCVTYNEISQQAFLEYTKAEAYLKSLGLTCWDYLSHSKCENDNYHHATCQREKSAITAIVFQALAVEAFVNLYGAQKIGEEVFYSKYETKGTSTLEKLKKIFYKFYPKSRCRC